MTDTPPRETQIEVANNRIGLPRAQRVVDEAMIERGCTELERWFPDEDWDTPPIVAAILRVALEVTDD